MGGVSMWARMGHGTAFLTDHSRVASGHPAGLERNACFDSQLPFFDLMEPQAHNSLHAFKRGLCRVQLPICQSYPRLFR